MDKAMDSMDKAMLEKSKGATYMSFILDVEIVIKKEGLRANLAESKLKSKNGTPKEGSDRKRKIKNKENENKNILDKPNNTAYPPVTTKQKNVFGEKNMSDDEDKGLTLEENDGVQCGLKQEMLEQLSKESKDVEDIQRSERDIETSGKAKKRKATRTERKSQVFKGKVEPIDFLECNRIFMCNHMRVKKYGNRKSILNSHHSTPTIPCTNVALPRLASDSEHKGKVSRVARIESLIPMGDSNYLSTDNTNISLPSKINKAVDFSSGDGNVEDLYKNHMTEIKSKTSLAHIKPFEDYTNNIIIQHFNEDTNNFLGRKCKSLESLKSDKINVEMELGHLEHSTGLAGHADVGDSPRRLSSQSTTCVIEEQLSGNWEGKVNKQAFLDLKIGVFNDIFNMMVPHINIFKGETELVSTTEDQLEKGCKNNINKTQSAGDIAKTRIEQSSKEKLEDDSCNLLYDKGDESFICSDDIKLTKPKKGRKKRFREALSGLFVCIAPQRER